MIRTSISWVPLNFTVIPTGRDTVFVNMTTTTELLTVATYTNRYSENNITEDCTYEVTSILPGPTISSGVDRSEILNIQTLVYILLDVFIGILAISGNALVCLAIYKNRKLQTITNTFIVSLAIADLNVGLFAIPFAIATFLGKPSNFSACLLINSFIIVLTQGSIFSLLAVACERYMAILSPLKHRWWLSHKRAICFILLTWLLAIAIGLLPLFGWNLGPPEEPRCYFVEVISMEYMVYFNFFVCVLTPLLILVAIYCRIFHQVKSHLKRLPNAFNQEIQVIDRKHRSLSKPPTILLLKKKELKTARLLALIVLFFAISWLPLHILNSLSLLCSESCSFPAPVLLAAIILSHANSAVNPFLYAFNHAEFRKTFRRIFNFTSSDNTNSNLSQRTTTTARSSKKKRLTQLSIV